MANASTVLMPAVSRFVALADCGGGSCRAIEHLPATGGARITLLVCPQCTRGTLGASAGGAET